MSFSIKILGCGGSGGVPLITNYWGVCDPNEPKNRRSRASIAIQNDKINIIVDTGPDFREQINREDIKQIDAIIYTHEHADHVNGIDDLRSVYRLNKKTIPVYSNKATIDSLLHRFDFMFETRADGFYPSVCETNIVYPEQSFTINDFDIQSYEMCHGAIQSLGLRINDFGYSADMKELSPSAIDVLKGIKTWVVDAAAYHSDSNPVHANLARIYTYNEQIGAKNVYLTSMPPTMDYMTLINELPDGYKPAYDGLTIEFD